MAKPENEVETYLHIEILKLGGTTEKWQGMDGNPDRIVLLPDNVVWFVEVKTLYGTLSTKQKSKQQRLKRFNSRVLTIYGKSGVDKFIYELESSGLF